jgi:hypothetical protein
MAYNLRFWYEYKDIADTLNRVEILYNGYVGDSYEVIAGATPFVPSINEGEGNKGGEIIDTLFSLQAVTSSQFNIEAFDSEAYGDVIFKYYHDSVLKYQGVIDAFETNQELLPNGTTVLILSAESGIKNLGKVYLKNSDDTAISGKVRIIEVIAKALRLLNAQNTANIVSIVNTSVYEGSTQVNADKDLFENITNIETFQNDNGEILTAYEAIKRCLGGIYTLKYFENQWYIEHIEAYTQASYYKTVYDYSGTRISRTSVTRTLKNIFEGDILRGGTEGKLFSKGKIVVKRNINSLISSLPNSDFEPIGSQLVHWTGVSSLSNSILGGYGTVDQPFYLQINGSVYDNTTPDTEFVESGSFNWYPYGRSDFANRPDANMYDEDEKLKFNLKNEYGSGISGARVQIMATYAFMDEDTQMPTMTPGTEEDISFTTFTYYYTNNGWSLDPGFYVTGNNAIESIEVDPPAVNRMGYFRYRSANTGTYYLKSPPTVSVKIRLFRGARLKIGASTNEESGYTYFVRYFRVTSSVWTQDEEILQSKVEKTYLTANNTDRLGNVDIGLDMYYPLYPYAFGSIFKDSSTNTPISGYKKPGESTIQAYDLFVGQSYLRRNSSRLHRMYIIKKSFDVSPDTLLTYDSKVYRIVKYDFNQRYGNCDMTILEVANNGVAISEKVSVSENQTVLDSSYKKVIYPPKAGDDRIKVDKYGNISLNHELNNITSFNKSGGYINLQKEYNEESSGVYFTNADGTMAQAMTPSAIGFDFKSDLNNFKVELDLFKLTKDVKVVTDDSVWMLGGNIGVASEKILGIDTAHNIGVDIFGSRIVTFTPEGNTGFGTSNPLGVIHAHANVSGSTDVVLLKATNQSADYFFSVTVNGDANEVRLYNSGLLKVKDTWQFDDIAHFATSPTTIAATQPDQIPNLGQIQSLITASATGIKPGVNVKVAITQNISKNSLNEHGGYTLVAGDRVLLTAQSTASENGIWIADAGFWTRATDSDSDAELRNFVYTVLKGTYKNYKFINTNQSAITVGTTTITYEIWDIGNESDPVFTAWRDLNRNKNLVWVTSATTNGQPASFRALSANDIPALTIAKITDLQDSLNSKQAALNGTGYVKQNGLVTSYDNREFVATTTNQSVAGLKTFVNGISATALYVVNGGYATSIIPNLTYNSVPGGARIQSGNSVYYDYKPLIFTANQYVLERGNLKLGGNNGFAATGVVDFATERLEVTGNIRYSGTLKPSNIPGTGWLKSNGTTDSWAAITVSDIPNLDWSKITTGKPTTLSGYGITDAQSVLNGTGFVKANGTTITYDNSTYLSTSVAATTYQPLDADLTSISALTGDGVLRKVSNVWNLDTDMYLTTSTKELFIATDTHVGLVNPGTTLTVNGLGNLNLKSGIVTTGTYRSVTVDTYGRVTAGTNPTTVVGYGLTDVWTKTESDARYLLQSSYNPTWGQLTGSPIDNTAFNSTMLGYVNTSTTQTGIAGSKTFTSAMYANGTLTTNQLFVKDTTGGNAYPLSIVNALTYNGWSGSSLIKSGLDIYNDYKPLVFLGSHFMMLRGSLK